MLNYVYMYKASILNQHSSKLSCEAFMQEAIFNPLIIFLKWANKPTFFHSFIIRKHLKHSVYMHILIRCIYCNDPKFLDRYAWANSADPDQTAPWRKFENLGSKSLQISVKNSLIMLYNLKEQSDQVLHCLPFRLHRLDPLLYGRATMFKF